ncbi:hypothetical protein IAR55_001209 [Kwoniella newhampshirensis]|uniref:Zn(2)-C6 fungal-type domain-containing protein n=1 Tax=Kwoniella newhampshirensis TaxID=1651941 RepID=A0AAW0Z5A0_9TREE
MLSSHPPLPHQMSYMMGDQSERSPPSGDDDEADDREAAPTRTNGSGTAAANRACDYCHRMKMKCIGKENPPCNRCRQSGHPCTFDGPRKSKSSKVEDRLRLVEAQIGAMQGSLQELLHLQRGAMANAAANDGKYSAFPRTSQSADDLNVHDAMATPNTVASLGSMFDPRSQPSPHFSIDPSLASSSRDPRLPHGPPIPPQHMAAQVPPGPSPWLAHTPKSRLMRTLTPQASPHVSEDEEGADPFSSDLSAAPWGNMLSLAEAARLKADSHIVRDDDDTGGRGRKRSMMGPIPGDGSDRGRLFKKSRTMSNTLDRSPELTLNERGRHVFPDPVDLGWCAPERGRQLFDLFFDKCGVYQPCFDPEYDTLRERSAFAITTILAVAAKCEDAAGPTTDLQLKCREHAEKIGMSTLFTPVSRVEIVQAMILLASWGETFWRPGGHAIRMAMDLGLYKCLPYLLESGMGVGKTPEEIENERPVVVGARVWLTLFKLEYEMSFAYGRPGLFSSESTIKNARKLLKHPLSLPTDARLVSSCESLAWRMPLHQPVALAPSNSMNTFSLPDMDDKLRQVNRNLNECYEYWDDYFAQKGIPEGHFLRETLITGRAGAFLATNSYVLHGVRSRRDVAMLSNERRQWLQEAGKRAQELVTKCLHGQQYTKNVQFANLLTHYNIAYAARFMIRMASLVPESCNLRQVGRDVEQVAQMLNKVPGFQFAHFLRDVVKKARRDHVLPPSSRAPSRYPSPTRNHMALPPMKSTLEASSSWSGQIPPDPSITPSGSSVSIPNVGINLELGGAGSDSGMSSHMDFLYAEQLFANTGPTTVPGPTQNFGFSLDAWFPFPPLDGDNSPMLQTTSTSTGTFTPGNGRSGAWW